MNETVNFERQYEEKPDVIEIGNYVRIVESADVGEQQDMIYTQDIQAVGVVRDYFSDLSGSYVEFPRGVFGLTDDELYLVDVDALHGEMEEILADKAWQEAWNNYEENPTKENGAAFAIANLRVSLLEAESEIREVATERDMALAETVKAVNAANELQARNRLLEEKLKPFALAALEDDVVKTDSEHTSEQLYTYDTLWETEQGIWFNGGNTPLTRTHLNEALEALPELKPGSAANGVSEQA